MNNHIHQRVTDLLSNKMNIEVPAPDTNLMEQGYLDSLSFVKMLSLLENEFEIQIEMDELDFEYFKNVNGITTFVQNKTHVENTG